MLPIPEELVKQAAALGYEAIAVTDRNTFAGIVRAYAAAKKCEVRLIVGVRLDLLDEPSFWLIRRIKRLIQD